MDEPLLTELKELYRDGFPEDGEGDVDGFFARVKTENAVYLTENGKIISAGYVMDKPAVLFGQKTRIPYLSALSTLSAYRGQGKLKAVINGLFDKLYRRGDFACVLYPFNHDYYKRFGFCTVSFCGERAYGTADGMPDPADFTNYLTAPEQSYPETDFTKSDSPYAQARIINAKKALLSAVYAPRVKKTVCLQIIDPLMKDNNITVKLTAEAGRASVSDTREVPDTVLDIAGLCRLVFLGGGIFERQRNLFIDRY